MNRLVETTPGFMGNQPQDGEVQVPDGDGRDGNGDSMRGTKRPRESLLKSPEPLADAASDEAKSVPIDQSDDKQEQLPPKKKEKVKAKISADEYARMTKLIVYHLRKQEEEKVELNQSQSQSQPSSGSADEVVDVDQIGCKCSSVVEWYLNEVCSVLCSMVLPMCIVLFNVL